jgi:poly-beta-1,6-N-acetyl-D-glucosamine synthase
MNWVFAASLVFVVYVYVGYPVWAYVRSRFRARPVQRAAITPRLSIVLAVHNEAGTLPRKIQNLEELDYPAERHEIIVVSDGSTDSTLEVLKDLAGDQLRAVILPKHEGKAVALNRGVESATGEIIVFTDARQELEPEALRHLVSNFADPEVGCASGELILGDRRTAHAEGRGVGLYWKFEKCIRKWESDAGSVVGATGALYAVRKHLLASLPPGTILDDVLTPLQVCRRGGRVVFDPRAQAWDKVASSDREFRRKVRTLTGNYQLLQLAPWLLSRSNPLRFEFVSHKLSRLLAPFALILLALSSVLASGPIYKAAALLQFVFYALAFLAFAEIPLGWLGRVANAALTFLLLNVAAAVALLYFIGHKREIWVP